MRWLVYVSILGLAVAIVAGWVLFLPGGGFRNVSPRDGSVQPASGTVYVANEVSNTVSVIDAATDQLADTIVLGDEDHHRPLYNGHIDAHGLGLSPDGRLLMVANRGSSTVVAIDTTTNALLGYVSVGREPHVPTFTPDGSEVWVTVRGEGYISVLSPQPPQEIVRVPTANGPGMVAFSLDGQYAYVSSQKQSTLSKIDTGSRDTVVTVPVEGQFSPFLLVSPDGREVWVVHKDVGKVSVVDADTLQVLNVVEVGSKPNHLAFVTGPAGEDLVYVTLAGEDAIAVVERSQSPRVVRKITEGLGQEPHAVWPNADGSRLYVGHERSNDVRVLDTRTETVVATIGVGKKPIDVVFKP